jgi:hypothetical protein
MAAGGRGGAGGDVTTKTGSIAVIQNVYADVPTPQAYVSATFIKLTERNPCRPTTMGSCRFYQCGTNPGMGSTLSYVQSGGVEVKGFDMPVPLDQTGLGDRSASFTELLWTRSRPLTAQVFGPGEVPAVVLEVVAPNAIALTSPVATGGMAPKISKGIDLVSTWSGGIEGTVEVEVTNDKGGVIDISIKCTAPASAGTVTVPAAFLGLLGTKGTFQATVQNVTTKAVNAWTMNFSATTHYPYFEVAYTK